jgi:hypothetical protein
MDAIKHIAEIGKRVDPTRLTIGDATVDNRYYGVIARLCIFTSSIKPEKKLPACGFLASTRV